MAEGLPPPAIYDKVLQPEKVLWAKGLFCADKATIERLGAMFAQGKADEAFKLAVSGEQCAAVMQTYEVQIRYFGKVYGHQGDYIQIVGVVPHGKKGPMSYIFIKLSTLAS